MQPSMHGTPIVECARRRAYHAMTLYEAVLTRHIYMARTVKIYFLGDADSKRFGSAAWEISCSEALRTRAHLGRACWQPLCKHFFFQSSLLLPWLLLSSLHLVSGLTDTFAKHS